MTLCNRDHHLRCLLVLWLKASAFERTRTGTNHDRLVLAPEFATQPSVLCKYVYCSSCLMNSCKCTDHSFTCSLKSCFLSNQFLQIRKLFVCWKSACCENNKTKWLLLVFSYELRADIWTGKGFWHLPLRMLVFGLAGKSVRERWASSSAQTWQHVASSLSNIASQLDYLASCFSLCHC